MKKKIIILTGPTGVGKTNTSIAIAKYLDTEIISADSMQIYKGMDIGTAKIMPNEMHGVVHHNLDIVSPADDYSVAEFSRNTKNIIEEIFYRDRVPLLVGGTGLYLDSIIYDLDFGNSGADEEYRRELEAIADAEGLQSLYEKLIEVDPAQAEKIDSNNRHRIIRALEIYHSTGEKPSEIGGKLREQNREYTPLYIVLTRDREVLYERINERVLQMVDDGLVEEVRALLESGLSKDLKAFKGIGYKEVIAHLEGRLDRGQMIAAIQQNSRRYAKRQLTWFRREPNAVWFDLDAYEDTSVLIGDIIKIIDDWERNDD